MDDQGKLPGRDDGWAIYTVDSRGSEGGSIF